MKAGHSKCSVKTDCCSDMYGLLDWACSESFVLAIVLVLGVLLVWKLLDRTVLDDDARRIEEASRRLNLSVKTSQRSQRHHVDNESIEDIRWSVCVGELNVKLSVDHTLEQRSKRDLTASERCERTAYEVTVKEPSPTALSSTASLDTLSKTCADDHRAADKGAVTSSVDNGMKLLSDREQGPMPCMLCAGNSHGLSASTHVEQHNAQWKGETTTTSLSGDCHGILEASERWRPVGDYVSGNDMQSLAKLSDVHPALDVIKAIIYEAGEFDSATVSHVGSSASIDQNPAGSVSGEANCGGNTNENVDGEWVVV